MQVEGLQGEVVNLGTDDEITIFDLAEVIPDLCDTSGEITHEPSPRTTPPDDGGTSRRLGKLLRSK